MHTTRINHNLLSSRWYVCLDFFAMKCLDQVETALKRWAPGQFCYLEHSSGFKPSRRSVRNAASRRIARKIPSASPIAKSEAKLTFKRRCKVLTMCEVEYMEGNNKPFCDRCKTNTTDTVLRITISALPDMLVLPLKPFDLDDNTFETVKLNSQCALAGWSDIENRKKHHSRDGIEAMEKAVSQDVTADGTDPMDTDADNDHLADPLNTLSDVNYDYKLAGVLVHAGVAQGGGHYYSFIRDRSNTDSDEDKW